MMKLSIDFEMRERERAPRESNLENHSFGVFNIA